MKKSQLSIRIVFNVCLFLQCLAFGVAHAADPTTHTWKLKTGGDWGTADNWEPKGVPDGNVEVIFPDGLTANATIRLDKQYIVNSLEFENLKTTRLTAGTKFSRIF